MREKLAALLALIFVISMAACAKTPTPAENPEPPAAVQEQPEEKEPPQPSNEEAPAKVLEPELEAPSAAQSGLAVDFTDTPQRVQADLEEIVSYDISVPQLTLANADAAEAINAGFVKLSDNLVKYAQETVYPTAQEKMTIGFLTARYEVRSENGQIIVDYTVEERYASDEEASETLTCYIFDAASGKRIADE